MLSRSMPRFRPLPFLSNPHVQTVVAHLSGLGRARLDAKSSLVPLPDGDSVGLHENMPDRWDGRNIAVLVHGLGGSSHSPYLKRVARRLLDRDVLVVRIDLRGAGISAAHCDKLYNAACSNDLREGVLAVHRARPEARIHLVGFSLGGNIALKMTAEAAHAPPLGLASVAAVAPPIDLVRCARLIEEYPFYDRFYVKNLTRQVDAHARHRPHLPMPVWPKGLTIRQFDTVYTAPRGGFRDVDDYYARASARPLLDQIAVPSYLITARDDPFVAWQPFAELSLRPDRRVAIADRGGHLGFLGPDGRGGLRWAETQIVEWIAERSDV